MKIDCVLVACCKKDYYLTRICVASIRFWNNNVPVSLLKDFSAGVFCTQELERAFNVGIAAMPFSRMNAYSKLVPFVNKSGERVMVIDSDIIWLGDMIPYLERFVADMVVQTYKPFDVQQEMQQWFFRLKPGSQLFQQYKYPGFLFNSGQMVVNTGIYPLEVVQEFINWEEGTTPKDPSVFKCADQDIVNYIFAKGLVEKKVTFAHADMFVWGWTYDQQLYSYNHVKQGKGKSMMIHWYGDKKGMLFAIPKNKLLYFFESYYYSQIPNGIVLMLMERLRRTIKHIDVFIFTLLKKGYRLFVPNGQQTG